MQWNTDITDTHIKKNFGFWGFSGAFFCIPLGVSEDVATASFSVNSMDKTEVIVFKTLLTEVR